MITLIVKVSLVLFIGAAVAGVLRGRSAATRHFVWALTLFATLLLLAIAKLAPEMTVRIPYGVKEAPDLTRFVVPSSVLRTPSPLCRGEKATQFTIRQVG